MAIIIHRVAVKNIGNKSKGSYKKNNEILEKNVNLSNEKENKYK